jgi:hypothetical protein
VVFDSDGNVLVSDSGDRCIRKVSSSGVVTTLAGNGKKGLVNGTGSEAMFNYPRGLCLARDQSVLVCDYNDRIIRYDSLNMLVFDYDLRFSLHFKRFMFYYLIVFL